MASRVTSKDILGRPKNTGGDRPSLSDAFLKLKPESPTKPGITTLRLIGFPIAFKEHTATKRDPENPKVPKKVPFSDADTNRSFTRICTENDPRFGACVWCEEGYKRNQRYSQNVLERYTEDGEKKSRVKILSKGPSLFEEFSKAENSNMELNAENGDNELCTFLGGATAHDIRIKSETDAAAFGGVAHTVTVIANKVTEVSQDEIDLLAAVGKPSAEEIEAAYAADPELREYPEWFLYGYRLENIHKPTAKKRPEQPSAPEDLSLDSADNDNDVVVVDAPKAGKKASTAPKAKAVVEEDANPFGEEGDDDLPF